MRKQIQLAILVGSTFLMSGCQLFQSNSARLQAGLRIPEQAEPRAFAQRQLEAGRAALVTQNYASAIAAFRNAALEPKFAPASHNGLGVAYAGIGRNDLAERYFRLAMAEDPATKRYADNLVRLRRANFAIEQARLAHARPAPTLATPRQAQIMRGTALRASLEVSTPAGRISRTAGTAVLVRAYEPRWASPVAPVAAARPRHEVLPTVAAREPVAPAAVPVAAPSLATAAAPTAPDLSRPELARSEAVVAVAVPESRPVTVVVPQAERQGSSAAVQTTGRRYPQAQFAEIFAPYAGGEARAPIMAGVSSPGLRSSALPQPTFGQPVAEGESLALANK